MLKKVLFIFLFATVAHAESYRSIDERVCSASFSVEAQAYVVQVNNQSISMAFDAASGKGGTVCMLPCNCNPTSGGWGICE